MKKIIYISGSASIIILMVMFYFNIAGGKEGSELKSPESQTENSLQSTGRVEQSNSPQSGGWQLQVMPNMGNRLVRDLYFTDSLTGYAVASPDIGTDSAHILKTTNGGNTWLIKSTWAGRLPRIIFLNANTGFAGGNYLLKTTNAGENWMVWNWPLDRIIFDMQVFNEDTIWYADRFQVGGGAYRTTNGGLNWEKRDSGIPANSFPDRIYFYNSRIGFAYQSGNPYTYKTTDAGLTWSIVFSNGFSKLEFKDSLNGIRASVGILKTTNGGMNWQQFILPNVLGNILTEKDISSFSILNDSIMYAFGAYIQYQSNFVVKGIIYKTTNYGKNWGYQIPDTSFGIHSYRIPFSINNNNLWVYGFRQKGLFSSTGGDTTIYVGVNNISTYTPNKYELYQNYPNPFNQFSIIQFKVSSSKFIKLVVYDISGKEVRTLVNGKYQPGTYQVSFNAEGLSSGVYFYSLSADDNVIQTKKLVLLK